MRPLFAMIITALLATVPAFATENVDGQVASHNPGELSTSSAETSWSDPLVITSGLAAGFTFFAVVVALFAQLIQAIYHRQGILRALYVETHHRAARVAADMTAFRKLVETIREHRNNGKIRPQDRPQEDYRYPKNILKFLPVPSEVYRQLGSDFGHLPKDVQGAVAMLHFRLEMVSRDIERISRSQEGKPLEDDAILQIAQRMHDACQPSVAALDALEKKIWRSHVLRKQLEKALDAAAFPVKGADVLRILKDEMNSDRPEISGVLPHLA